MLSNHSHSHQHTKTRDTVNLVARILTVLLLLLIFLHGHGWAQGFKGSGNVVMVHVSGAPTGTCFSFNVAVDDTSGDFYDCFLGTWFKVDVAGVGGGSGTVTHATGALTSGQFIFGNGGADIKAATAATTNLHDVSAAAPSDGQVLIFDGPSSTYIPGDPRVQGLAADSTTTVLNPVEIGGYDTAGTPAIHRAIWLNANPSGTEYGEVVRNIPSGTQAVSGTVAVSNFPATQAVTGTVAVSNFPATQPVSIAASIAVTQATGANLHAVLDSGTTTVTQATGTNLHTVVDSAPTTAITAAALPLPTGASTSANQSTVKAASTASVATDTSSVVQISPNQPNLTTPLNIQGGKTDNSATPGANNLGTLPSVANAAPPTKTETDQVALSTDLAGNLRVYNHPPNVLGCYMVNGRTPVYAAQGVGAPLFSFRWGSATGALAVIMRVRVNVATTVTSTTNSGAAERELVVARGFTASDTGGTAITLTGNNQKMRTSQATSLVTDMRAGGPLTAGTRTLDANPISSVLSWLGVNFIGVDIGSGGSSATAAAWTGLGGVGMIPLLDAVNGQDYPLVLAQNEGFIIRIGKDAQPTGFTQQTYFNISWCEVSAY